MPNSKQIVYLSQAQYTELITNGTITVNGVTVTYNENDIYVTPQAEPVTDVRVAGTSVAANGVADIPIGGINVNGVVNVSPNSAGGLDIQQTTNPGRISIVSAISSNVKAGTHNARPIVPANQHEAAFYGLAKVAGHDEASSTESLGTYTPGAKAAIQQMLGISNLLAPSETTTASKAYSIGEVFTSNGKLYKATAAIVAADAIVVQNEGEEISGHNAVETKVTDYAVRDVQVNGTSVITDGVANVPKATNVTPGVACFEINDSSNSYGLGFYSGNSNLIVVSGAALAHIKNGTNGFKPIVPSHQHESAFYGLAKAAGDSTQAASANAVGTYTDEAKAAIRTMLGAIGTTDYASSTDAGIVKVSSNGITLNSSGVLTPQIAIESDIKTGTTTTKLQIPANQHISTFYGLAKASGDTTQSASSNAIGTYTDSAKASIKSMLGIVDGSTGTVSVSGTTPTIAAVENTRYVCGEVSTLSFTPAASGTCIVRFTSGSTATVLTLPSTVKFPEWFDATALEADTIYELCITDGIYGAVMSWAQ